MQQRFAMYFSDYFWALCLFSHSCTLVSCSDACTTDARFSRKQNVKCARMFAACENKIKTKHGLKQTSCGKSLHSQSLFWGEQSIMESIVLRLTQQILRKTKNKHMSRSQNVSLFHHHQAWSQRKKKTTSMKTFVTFFLQWLIAYQEESAKNFSKDCIQKRTPSNCLLKSLDAIKIF